VFSLTLLGADPLLSEMVMLDSAHVSGAADFLLSLAGRACGRHPQPG
jgi:hypothetical protein